MLEKSMQKYLEISAKIEKGEKVSDEEKAFLIEVRKSDNAKMRGQIKKDTVYYMCDRSRISTMLKESEFDKVIVRAKRVDSGKYEEVGIEEFYNSFEYGEYFNNGISVIVVSKLILELWDKSNDYLTKDKKEEYVVKATYKFDEVTCVYKNE